MVINKKFWKGKKVLITGNTGFKGSWLSLFLLNLDAKVFGYSIDNKANNIFYELSLDKKISHIKGNINNFKKIRNVINDIQPDIIIHMAAQSIVSLSYQNPLNTWKTNVIGTANILESARSLVNKCSIIIVTTDKVYENLNLNKPYKESDRLGGVSDPYSASKAACEFSVSCWRKSYLNNTNISVKSARGGNVIGGGDWSKNRIIPDVISSIIKNKKIELRNPMSTRPWQYILDVLSGYLKLAEVTYANKNKDLINSYNFGPDISENINVETLVKSVLKEWSIEKKIIIKKSAFDEFQYLVLSNENAINHLGWRPIFDFNKSIEQTVQWYKSTADSKNYLRATQEAIEHFVQYSK